MSRDVFISYRRDDASSEAGRLADAIRTHFGQDSVFMDTSDTRLGAEWPEALRTAVAKAAVVIAVIGGLGFAIRDGRGARRAGADDRAVGQRLGTCTLGLHEPHRHVTLSDGDRVAVQRYRRRRDAEHRPRVMRALWAPAAKAEIAIPRIRESNLDADPPWVMFEALPGVPVPEAGDGGLEDPGFPVVARAMGELLASFRQLPTAGLMLDGLWADPVRLAARAAGWLEEVGGLDAREHRTLLGLLERIPTVFANRPVVLAHGDFAPVNVLTDGESLTGLIDFE